MKINIFRHVKNGISQKFAKKKNSFPTHSSIPNLEIRRVTLKEFSDYKKAIKEKKKLATIVSFASTLVDLPSNKVNTTILPAESNLKKIYEEFLKTSNETSLSIPEKGKIFATDDSFIKLVETYEDIMKRYANNSYNMSLELYKRPLDIVVPTTVKYTVKYIPKPGLVRWIYTAGHWCQIGIPALHVSNAVIYAKSFKVTGLPLFRSYPLLLFAVPTISALGFYGFSSIVGDNSTLGKALNFGGYIMMTPMRYFELVFNTYLTPKVFSLTGIPVVLNYTKVLEVGHGIEYADIQRYIGDNLPLFHKIYKAVAEMPVK
jgi:hypothetical protein